MLDRRGLIEARGRKRVVKLDDALLRVDDNYEQRAGAQIGADLIVDVDSAIVGRKNLDRNVGCERRCFQLVVVHRAKAIVRNIRDVGDRTAGKPRPAVQR